MQRLRTITVRCIHAGASVENQGSAENELFYRVLPVERKLSDFWRQGNACLRVALYPDQAKDFNKNPDDVDALLQEAEESISSIKSLEPEVEELEAEASKLFDEEPDASNEN